MCLLICTDFSVERCDQFKLLLLHILDINKTPQRFTMTEKGCTKTLSTDFSVERCDQFKLLLLHILDINKIPQRFTMTEVY